MTVVTPPEGSTPPATGAPATPGQPAAAAPSPAPSTPAQPNPTPAPAPSGSEPSPAPAPSPPNPTPSPAPEAFKVPDAFKDKGWVGKYKFNSVDDVFKVLDDAQTAIGKKMIVPDLEKATETEREDYFKLSRPANGVEAYQFGDVIDPNLKQGMGESLLKNGVSAFQANNIIKDYQAGEAKILAHQFSPDGMKEAMSGAFGADWEKVTGQTKAMLTGLMSAEDNKLIDNLPNAYIALIYRTLGNTVKAYGINESFAHITAPTGTTTPQDIESVRAAKRGELAKLGQGPQTLAVANQKQTLIDEINDTYKNDPRIRKA